MDVNMNRRILLIDDNESIHDDIRKVLEQPADTACLDAAEEALFGSSTSRTLAVEYEIDSAFQGEQGVALVDEALSAGRPYAMAFVDMRMPPGLDGLETIEKLWNRDPDLQVVVCSAYSDYSWSQICERLPQSSQLLVLKKPFEPIEISQLAMALTEKWTLSQLSHRKMDDLNRAVEAKTIELQRANEHLQKANDKLQYEVRQRRKAEEHLWHSAFHDDLTGLPNRALLKDRLARAIARKRRDDDFEFALLFIDLDNFKIVNDGLGHDAGDQVLVEVAARLKSNLRWLDTATRLEDETAARFGGDEFVVLLEGIRDQQDAEHVAGRVVESLAAPLSIGGQEATISASIGLVCGGDYEIEDDIFRDADMALYAAKADGKGQCICFTEDMRLRAQRRTELERDLRQAVERRQIIVAYQPVVSLVSGRLQGFEALARWDHPEMGSLPAGEFIPMAEETGVIMELGVEVLRKACGQFQAWRRQYTSASEMVVSVNLSPRQLLADDICSYVQAALNRYDIPPNQLALEITETGLVEGEKAIRVVEELRSLGVRLYLDDFGTGYSGIAHLHRLPIDGIKIDRSFVKDMIVDRKREATVAAIQTLTRSANAALIAEGIEKVEQLTLLKALGCDLGQGFLFAKPLSPEKATELIRIARPWPEVQAA